MTEAASITCPRCGWTSHNLNDIAVRYCGHCHDFMPPADSADAETHAQLTRFGYSRVRKLANGEWAGMLAMLFTYALVYGLDEFGDYKWRYCYEHAGDVVLALSLWDGTGHPPGAWIKRKGHPAEGELLGPGATGQP
jgi:hypothetical protein